MNARDGGHRGPPQSPCTKVCAMDAADRYCVGCGRTRAEIAHWWLMPDAAKRAVLAELPARRRPAAPDSKPPAPPVG